MAARTIYDSFTRDLADRSVDLNGGNLYVMLVRGYTPNVKAHSRRSHVTGEVSGVGYTAGGQSLAGVAGGLDTVNDKTVYTATNPAWPTASVAADGAVVYQSNGGAASADPLVAYVDFGGTVTATNAAFTITSFATNGFLAIKRG